MAMGQTVYQNIPKQPIGKRKNRLIDQNLRSPGVFLLTHGHMVLVCFDFAVR